MSFYSDSRYPVRDDIANVHAEQFAKFGAPGTWGTAKQRLAIVAEGRQAGYDAGIMEKPDDEGYVPDMELSEVSSAFLRNNRRMMPVIEEDTLVGIVARNDILHTLVKESDNQLNPDWQPKKESG